MHQLLLVLRCDSNDVRSRKAKKQSLVNAQMLGVSEDDTRNPRYSKVLVAEEARKECDISKSHRQYKSGVKQGLSRNISMRRIAGLSRPDRSSRSGDSRPSQLRYLHGSIRRKECS